jgi:uncharacterized protein (DUF433 family)
MVELLCAYEAHAASLPLYTAPMAEFDRITIEPGKMGGQPCIRGMRLTVRRVLEVLATYEHRADIALNYPELEDEDIKQALLYAAGNLDDEVFDAVYDR